MFLLTACIIDMDLQYLVALLQAISMYKTVADPGFPRGRGANSPGGGAPTYDFAKFSQKLHEIERIWTPRGARIQNFTM